MNAATTPQRILIVRASAIGDIVFASPLAAALRRTYPRAHIAWLVERGLEDLLAGDSSLDALIAWPRSEWRELWRAGRYVALSAAVRAFRAQLRAQRFDLALDLQGLLKSGTLAWMSGAARRIGLNSREGSRLLMSEVVAGHGRIERISSEYLHLAQALHLEEGDFVPGLHVPPGARDSARATLASHGLACGAYVAIAPFTTRAQKHWFDDAWRELAQRIEQELRLPVVMLGGPADRARAQALLAGTHGIVDLVGSTRLGEAMAVVEGARLIIGVDTGLTHMGIGFRRPTVALFGSTRPYLDTCRENAQVIWLGLDCAPCRRHPTCGGAFTCMRRISPEAVLERARLALGR